jgi:hypothetical protein
MNQFNPQLQIKEKEMPIIKIDEWNKYVELNKDPYGKCCVDVAREVMHLLDEPNRDYENIDTHGIICEAEKNIDEDGITGFMAGCIAQMVSQYHSRGEEFRQKWNEDNGIKDKTEEGGIILHSKEDRHK